MNRESMIDIKMEVAPLEFNLANIEEVTVSLGATNSGKRTQETKLNQCQLYINGESSFAWSLTLGNGHRSDDWYHLPGKESVKMEWAHLARSLFPAPGTYQLRLELENEIIQEIEVVCHEED